MEDKEYAGQCLGNYDENAEECKVCEISDECKKETEDGGNNNDSKPRTESDEG